MNFSEKMSVFRRVTQSKPEPDVRTVTNTVFPALAGAMLSSAEAMSYVLIKQVQELENAGKFDTQMRFWVWRNFKVAVFKLVEAFTKVAKTNRELFLEAISNNGIETVIAMFIWTAEPSDRDAYEMVELFMEAMTDSELNKTRYPIDYQKVYRMFHYFIDKFGLQILRDRCDERDSARIMDAIEVYMDGMYDNAKGEYTLQEINNFIVSRFKSETFEWKYNFIHSIFLDTFSK